MAEPFSHLKDKKMEKAEEALINLKADIEGLKLKLGEDLADSTCQLSEDSETIKGMRRIEEGVQKVLENSLEEFTKDSKNLTKDKLDNCSALIGLLDKYRYIKVQLELLKFVKFSTIPVKQ